MPPVDAHTESLAALLEASADHDSSQPDPGKSHKHGFFSKFRHGD
jgi:hypothetical protein